MPDGQQQRGDALLHMLHVLPQQHTRNSAGHSAEHHSLASFVHSFVLHFSIAIILLHNSGQAAFLS
jgi:hypothetical protein